MSATDADAQDVADPLRSHPSEEPNTGSPLAPLNCPSLLRRGTYHRIPSATGHLDSIALGDDVPSPNELGILPRADTSWPRITAVSGAEASLSPTESPPLTGASLGGFSIGSSTGSSAAASPHTGFLSRKRRKPATLIERFKRALTGRSRSSHETGSEPLRTSVGSQGPPAVSGYSDEEAAAAQNLEQDGGGEKFDKEAFRRKFGMLSPESFECCGSQLTLDDSAEPPTYCSSEMDIRNTRLSFYYTIILCIISLVASGAWLALAIIKLRYGRFVSSSGLLPPTTATILATLVSRMIELLFATVFISCVGQFLSRRSVNKPLRGMTLAEMTMRNWVFQPGTIMTSYRTLQYAFSGALGPICLVASVAAMLYTPASDALVSPKLVLGEWESGELVGLVRSSFANSMYAKMTCPYLLGEEIDKDASESCLNVQFSGESYRNLQGYMKRWMSIGGLVSVNASGSRTDLASRPVGTNLLHDNTTMTGAWIEREHANVTRKFEEHHRIVNNVTLAMPHPGVYAAATNRSNGFLQPDELDSMGEYAIRASVVSPTINVMCVNMDRDELAPIVYTEWPASRFERTGVGSQIRGQKGWTDDVPRFVQGPRARYLNRTVVDSIFRWGPEYGRWPPVFQLVSAMTPSSVPR